MRCVHHCIYSINIHLHTQWHWEARMRWGERFPWRSWFTCMRGLSTSWSCPSVCQDLNSGVVGRETHAFHWICLFIWISRWSQKCQPDSDKAVCFSLLSSSNHQFQSELKYVANAQQADRSCSKCSVSQSYSIGRLFLGKGGLSVPLTSVFPVPRAVPLRPYLPVL